MGGPNWVAMYRLIASARRPFRSFRTAVILSMVSNVTGTSWAACR